MSGPTIEEIDEQECLELLRNKSKLGRVGFIEDGHPMILPVNYVAEEGSVVFRTPAGTKLSHLKNAAPAAFEVDSSRSAEQSGWSVLVRGTASEVSDPHEIDLLGRGPLESWGAAGDGHWVRITIDHISGRRISQE